jgi:hypothetical protein
VRLAAWLKLCLVVVLLGALGGSGAFGVRAASGLESRGKLVVVGEDLTTGDYAHDGLYTVNADGSGFRRVADSVSDGEPH